MYSCGFVLYLILDYFWMISASQMPPKLASALLWSLCIIHVATFRSQRLKVCCKKLCCNILALTHDNLKICVCSQCQSGDRESCPQDFSDANIFDFAWASAAFWGLLASWSKLALYSEILQKRKHDDRLFNAADCFFYTSQHWDWMRRTCRYLDTLRHSMRLQAAAATLQERINAEEGLPAL